MHGMKIKANKIKNVPTGRKIYLQLLRIEVYHKLQYKSSINIINNIRDFCCDHINCHSRNLRSTRNECPVNIRGSRQFYIEFFTDYLYDNAMLSGIAFWTDDNIWIGILTDLGGVYVDKNIADLIFIPSKYPAKINPSVLKSRIMSDIDKSFLDAALRVCRDKSSMLSRPQIKIIALLERSGLGGISGEDLRAAMGYSADAATHALDTAIYNIRKIMGSDFIKTNNGKYELVISEKC